MGILLNINALSYSIIPTTNKYLELGICQAAPKPLDPEVMSCQGVGDGQQWLNGGGSNFSLFSSDLPNYISEVWPSEKQDLF